jgi:hypothetical protein
MKKPVLFLSFGTLSMTGVTTQVLKVNLNLLLKQDSFGRTGT